MIVEAPNSINTFLHLNHINLGAQDRGVGSSRNEAVISSRRGKPPASRNDPTDEADRPGLFGRIVDVFTGEREERHQQKIARLKVDLCDLAQERAKLTYQFHEAEQEVASLRNHLQIVDSLESREVVQFFQSLKLKIKNACLSMSAHLADFIAARLSESETPPFDSGFKYDVETLQKILTGGMSLITLLSNDDYQLEDFLEYALRFSMSSKLDKDLFRRFHPGNAKEQDTFLLALYEKIRTKGKLPMPSHLLCTAKLTVIELQAASARWRSTAFLALANDDEPGAPEATEASWSDVFVTQFEKDLLTPLLKSVCGFWDSEMFPGKHREVIIDIAQTAYRWNSDVKSQFFQLDFHPTLFPDQSEFDDKAMVLDDERNKRNAPRRGRILVSVGLGLESTLYPAAGKPIDRYWQEKSEVLLDSRSTSL